MNKKHWVQRILCILLWIVFTIGIWSQWELILEKALLLCLVAIGNVGVFFFIFVQEVMHSHD